MTIIYFLNDDEVGAGEDPANNQTIASLLCWYDYALWIKSNHIDII